MLTLWVHSVDTPVNLACTGGLPADERPRLLVIVGLIVLLGAPIVGVLSSAWAGHPLTDFSVLGYHLTGSTGTLFLFGIAVGAVASLGIRLLLTGTRSSA